MRPAGPRGSREARPGRLGANTGGRAGRSQETCVVCGQAAAAGEGKGPGGRARPVVQRTKHVDATVCTVQAWALGGRVGAQDVPPAP